MKYIASCSFGKDSVATVLLALEHNEPLDEVVFTEVMYDHARNMSGEIPEHIDWIRKTAIPKFAEMGVKTTVLRSERDYIYYFKNAVCRGKYEGKFHGFPIGGRCVLSRDCKINPIKKYLQQFGKEVTQYIGIAIDEPKRLARLTGNKISLLSKYGYTEAMAKELCKKYNLLSPIYDTDTRGGCWFCPNARICNLSKLRKNHPDLWQELERLSQTPNLCSYGFKYGKTVQEVAAKLDNYDKKQAEIMNIREQQLTLFPELEKEFAGGIV